VVLVLRLYFSLVKTKVKRGRPRDPGVDAAIVDAAAEVLSRRGYARMTVAGVAALAGVSEPTVYLRYASKRDLALAAVSRLPLLVDRPDTGDAFEDLTALLTRLVAATQAASGMALTGAVLAEEHNHPELLERWRAGVGTALRTIVAHIVERGQNRGQLRAGLNADLVTDLLLGAHLAHYTYRGPPGRGWARQVTNALRPVLEV
jgi:AcrR family transcriptional regulator